MTRSGGGGAKGRPQWRLESEGARQRRLEPRALPLELLASVGDGEPGQGDEEKQATEDGDQRGQDLERTGGGGTGSRRRLRPGIGDGAERGVGRRLWRWGTVLEAGDSDEEERRRELTLRPGVDGRGLALRRLLVYRIEASCVSNRFQNQASLIVIEKVF
jgi:hypothetical protein